MRITQKTAAALRDYLSGDAFEDLENGDTDAESLNALRAVAERLEQATVLTPEVDNDLCEAFSVLSAY